MKRLYNYLLITFLLAGNLLVISSCSGKETDIVNASEPSQTAANEGETGEAPETATPAEPTPTVISEPLAAMVNGVPIFLSDYEEELKRYQAALEETGQESEADSQRQIVLDNLINEELLNQAAQQSGLAINDADFQGRFDALVQEVGGEGVFSEWLASNFYLPESFMRAYRRSINAALQRDAILAAMPAETEQVHALQIFVTEKADAEEVLNDLNAGYDFETLADLYDIVTGGELGWFPRNYLTQTEVEEAAFQLEPGHYSQIIESSLGFHILYILEKENRALDPDAYRVMAQLALEDWVSAQRSISSIEVSIP